MRPETYALTTIAYQRHRAFQVTANADLLIATVFRYRDQSRFLLHGFAVMPEHMHVLLTPAETIERAVQLIKGGYSFAVRKEGPGEIWQPGYHAHRITSSEDYRAQLAYIADNPAKRRLVEYPYVHMRYVGQLDRTPVHCRT
jgi:putative transposase